jgi:hypothetical protein
MKNTPYGTTSALTGILVIFASSPEGEAESFLTFKE